MGEWKAKEKGEEPKRRFASKGIRPFQDMAELLLRAMLEPLVVIVVVVVVWWCWWWDSLVGLLRW